MEIRLRPELEALIREDVQRGAYQNVDEFVERAVAMLHEQESWLADHRGEIEEQIRTGYESAQRGDLVDAEQVRSRVSDLKRAKLAERPGG